MAEDEFFANSSIMLIAVIRIYQSVETQPKLMKWKCSQEQFKLKHKIKNKTTKKIPKCLPGLERLCIQQSCGEEEI